jgi:hypothetical protein
LFADPPPLVTTPLVVAEGHGWFLKRYDRYRAMLFLAMVEAMPLEVAAVGPLEQRAATDLMRRFSDQDLTVPDAVGLHVMTKRRTPVCWSTDRHLALTGVALVIHAK